MPPSRGGPSATLGGDVRRKLYVVSEEAVRDIERILEESAAVWGAAVARKTHARLLTQFERVGTGTAVGHRRRDVPPRLPFRFLSEPPFVIAHDPATRTIARVLYGRSDIARAFRP
jgi:plasmid stabilization system protein ParE